MEKYVGNPGWNFKSLHQTDGDLEDVVLQREVGETVPKAAGSSLGLLPCLEQVLAGIIDFELGHLCSFFMVFGLWIVRIEIVG